MNIDEPLALLGGLTPQAFMARYWQREPLLIRQAIPGFVPSLSINDIRRLVRRDEVESRLVWQDEKGWNMKTGPFSRLPSARKPNWSVLAQRVDLHDDATAALMHQFRFISDARLDDAMISIASDGGGAGPCVDSYDVFLLQGYGRRRWRISRQTDLRLEPGLPLKVLQHFEAEDEYILEPGDMLYLPPHVAHEDVALGDCMTISIGFRAPTLATLACGMLECANDQIMANLGDMSGMYAHPPLPGVRLSARFQDPGTPATVHPAALPDSLVRAARKAIEKVDFNDALATRFLGQWLTDLSPNALFEPSGDHLDLRMEVPADGRLVLDRCTRLLYRDKALFINGEVAAVPASSRLRRLADHRELPCNGPDAAQLKKKELRVLNDWLQDGWIHHLPA